MEELALTLKNRESRRNRERLCLNLRGLRGKNKVTHPYHNILRILAFKYILMRIALACAHAREDV
jgi:hypothetical protein